MTSAPPETLAGSGTLDIVEYEPYIGPARVQSIRCAAAPLEGRSWTNINSTCTGGGVAEILSSLVPLARGAGLDAEWLVIHGDDRFFQTTKKLHNLLQGVDQPIDLDELNAYLDTIDDNMRARDVRSDLVVIHDPQPAAAIATGALFGNVVWRCHLDTSAPNKMVWRFLLSYINQCAGAIFTDPDFVGPGIQIPTYCIRPCIDPLAEKNYQHTRETALDALGPLLNAHNVDPDRPILAAVSRYDIHKNQATILRAFAKLREERHAMPPPYLIFLGNTAADDPEGGAVLEELRVLANDDPDVRFWVNVPDNDRVVGALMHLARAFVHISTREGFGLVVSEALWQGTPVIGSAVGGIRQQVIDGDTGIVVHPLDVEATAGGIARLLEDSETARHLGAAGREHVRKNFLLPELLRHYLSLLAFYAGAGGLPKSRMNPITYRERLHAVTPWHPELTAPSAAPEPTLPRMATAGS